MANINEIIPSDPGFNSSGELSSLIPKDELILERMGPVHNSEGERIWLEKYAFVNTKAIIIVGPPGSGSSTIASLLAGSLGIPEGGKEGRVFKIGELRRRAEEERRGTRHIEDMVRDDPKLEHQTDIVTRRELRKATESNPAIFEAQLGGYIATTYEEQLKRNRKRSDRVAKFILTVDPLEGGRRVRLREEAKARKDIEEKKSKGETIDAKLLARLNRTPEYWAEVNTRRHEKDLKNWRAAYPDLRGIDPQDTKALERDGKTPIWKRYYDFKLDTTFADLETLKNQILITLLENGYIRRKTPEELKKTQEENILRSGEEYNLAVSEQTTSVTE